MARSNNAGSNVNANPNLELTTKKTPMAMAVPAGQNWRRRWEHERLLQDMADATTLHGGSNTEMAHGSVIGGQGRKISLARPRQNSLAKRHQPGSRRFVVASSSHRGRRRRQRRRRAHFRREHSAIYLVATASPQARSTAGAVDTSRLLLLPRPFASILQHPSTSPLAHPSTSTLPYPPRLFRQRQP